MSYALLTAPRSKPASAKRARGAVLVISLLFLLIITLVATASVNVTVMEEKMAANNQYKTMSFQIAESAIQRYWSVAELERLWDYAAQDYTLEQNLANAYDPIKDGGVSTRATATVVYCGERGSFDAGGLNADKSLGAANIKLHVFDVSGFGEVTAINARTANERRGGFLKPGVDRKNCQRLY